MLLFTLIMIGLPIIFVALIIHVIVTSYKRHISNVETMPEELEIIGEKYPTDDCTDYDDFPEPDFRVPDMIPDPLTCLSLASKYDNLANQARDCGYDDLVEQYENAADYWQSLYEEAEDEEMEW